MGQIPSTSGNIAIVVTAQANGCCVCEVTPSLDGQTGPAQSFHGQNRNHAIGIALENLAHSYRSQAEAEQNTDWEAVDRSPSGRAIDKHFHVILHYERIATEESKFEAMLNTHLGNTVIETAYTTIIQVDPDLPIEPIVRGYEMPD